MIGTFWRDHHQVEALQYTGENFEECRDFAGADKLTRQRREEFRDPDGQLAVRWILHFDHPLAQQSLYPGWWLIRVGRKHMALAMSDELFQREHVSEPPRGPR